MDLIWGEDYDVLAEVSRAVFQRVSPLTDREISRDLADEIRELAELGWLELGDPRSAGSEAADLASMAAVFVELGRALVRSPLPALTTARDAALLCGSRAADDLAARAATGGVQVFPAFTDPAWRRPAPRLRDGVLTGTVLDVPYADAADVLLVEATENADTDEPVEVLIAVHRGPRMTIDPMPNLGGYRMSAVEFRETPVAEADVLARGPHARTALVGARQRTAILTAAQVYGAGSALLDRTVDYARERRQFGGPIGRFQAVQYLCTDIAVDAHLTSAFIRDAARIVDEGDDAGLAVALMCKQARRTAEQMVHAAHEVHAGIGFMVETDIHLFTKAAKKWVFDLGGCDERHDGVIHAEMRRQLIGARL